MQTDPSVADVLNFLKKNVTRKISEIEKKGKEASEVDNKDAIYVEGYLNGSQEALNWVLDNINDLMEEKGND